LIIKICGLTNIDDVLSAINFGADWLGFIFAESPRKIDINRCKQISDYLKTKAFTSSTDNYYSNSNFNKKIYKVGVFMNQSIEEILEITNFCDLDIIQLHGNENVFNVKQRTSKLILKRIIDFSNTDDYSAADYLLFDKSKNNGQLLSFEQIDKLKPLKPYLVAGGLNIENIIDVKTISKNAAGFDVSSGIEYENQPGKKDINKLKKFIELLRS